MAKILAVVFVSSGRRSTGLVSVQFRFAAVSQFLARHHHSYSISSSQAKVQELKKKYIKKGTEGRNLDGDGGGTVSVKN